MWPEQVPYHVDPLMTTHLLMPARLCAMSQSSNHLKVVS